MALSGDLTSLLGLQVKFVQFLIDVFVFFLLDKHRAHALKIVAGVGTRLF